LSSSTALGPFHRTAKPLLEACIRNGVHYLDIAAELDSYEHADELIQAAKDAKVILMLGSGGSVANLGSLAMFVVERMDSPVSIDIVLHVAGPISRGSAISAQESTMNTDSAPRNGGKQVLQGAESVRVFDFGDGRGEVECFPVTLPDLITIPKATRVLLFAHIFMSLELPSQVEVLPMCQMALGLRNETRIHITLPSKLGPRMGQSGAQYPIR
jgi:short subunit dehydrogenase-like uncharacterized protein